MTDTREVTQMKIQEIITSAKTHAEIIYDLTGELYFAPVIAIPPDLAPLLLLEPGQDKVSIQEMIRRIDENMAAVSATIMRGIVDARDGMTGKPLFSNDKARDCEQMIREDSNESLQIMKRYRDEYKALFAARQAESIFRERMFRVEMKHLDFLLGNQA